MIRYRLASVNGFWNAPAGRNLSQTPPMRNTHGAPSGGASPGPVFTATDVPAPRGFLTHAANVGIKDETPDLSVLASHRPCVAEGVFTKSLFAGPSVRLSRRHLSSGRAQAIVTVSKNANVATGAEGEANAEELAALTARLVGCRSEEVLVGSTGVIGRQYPMDRVRSHFAARPALVPADLLSVATAMMTTDTVPKVAAARVGDAVVSGVAKGSGMIEPDMATLLAYVATDADVPPEVLRPMFRRVVDATFNCLSIDSDTSTSDSAILLANGVAGAVPVRELEEALYAVAHSLTRQLARDGEGATKLLQVTVTLARDRDQAKRVAKAVVNSPLVKTAVHGADPNWGRVLMAIGKCWADGDIAPESVRVSFGDFEVYPAQRDDAGVAEVAALLDADEVEINIELCTGHAGCTVWGCDLSEGYVRINADYTT